MGYEELVDTAVDILETAEVLQTAFSDGVQITDVAVLFATAPKITEIAKDGRKAVEELLDLNADEAELAAAEIARRTGKPQQGIIARVNEAFTLAARTYGTYRRAELLAKDWQRWAKSLKPPVAA